MLDKLIHIEGSDSPETRIFSHLDDKVFKEQELICCDGQKLTKRLLQSPYACKGILAVKSFYEENESLIMENMPSGPMYCAPKKVVEGIVGYRLHKGVISIGERPRFTELHKLDDRILVLNDVQNSENVGAIVRSAHAFGIRSIIIDSTGCSPFVRRCARVSMGSVFKMKVHQTEDILSSLNTLKESGFHLVSTGDQAGAKELAQTKFPNKGALIVGNEGHGVLPSIVEIAHENVRIETSADIDSLNVSIATSLLLYKWKQCF